MPEAVEEDIEREWTAEEIMSKRILVGIVIASIVIVVALPGLVLAGLEPTDIDKVIIDNLEYTPHDYNSGAGTTDPTFSCSDMSSMSYRFFEKAGYSCQIIAGKGGDYGGHAWLESPAFPTGYIYEPTCKDFRPKSDYDKWYPEQWNYIPTTRWINWYDWKYTRGDMNCDGNINILDFVLFAEAYDTDVREVTYAMLGDMDLDGDIDILDFFHFAAVYSK